MGNIDELKKAPQALIDALSDPNRDVRRNAAGALGNIGDEAAVLVFSLEHPAADQP